MPDLPTEQEEIDAAFEAAFDLSEEERPTWLAQQFGNRPVLLGKITHLLEQERYSRALFDQLAGQRAATLESLLGGDDLPASADPRIGKSYGPWRVTAHLGSGGLAEVYEVCRADGRYEQRAALKILRKGILGPVARELFLRERRLLANLEQPGIVRIIDGGETPTGSPWLVMELVEGEPIDVYCDLHELSHRERLALLADAADILSAAHGRLVMHGDLKVEHLLVTPSGQLRLLDFGIAQALDEFGVGGRADGFSPGYASPEQSEGKTLSAASDIYQLGQIIARVTSDTAGQIALQAVIAHATQPAPSDRYASMAELAADLRALIADRPIIASPDSSMQALLRVVRHNRLATALAALAIVGSVGWGVTATLSSAAIKRERNAALAAADREERGKDVLLELFRRADMLEADSLGLEPAEAAAMLEETLAAARKSLADDPAMLADLMDWTARAQLRAGDEARARSLAEEGLTKVRQAKLDGSPHEAAAMGFLAYVLARNGETERAETLSSQALALLDNSDPAEPRAADALLSLAWAAEGDWPKQQGLFERALVVTGKLGREKQEIEIRSGLSRALAGQGDLVGARKQVEEALRLARRYFGERHPRLALVLSDYGRLEEKAGNADAAIARHREALTISEAAFGPSHSSTLAHRNNLALALLAAGQSTAAISEYQRLLALQPEGLPRGEVAQNLGATLVQSGSFDRAEQPLAIAEQSFARHLPADHPRRAFPALTRSELRLGQGRFVEAEKDARAALLHLAKVMPPGHFATETARCRVGIALIGQGRRGEAAAFVRPALKALEAAAGSVPARYVEPCRNAAKAL
ncbi:MAG: tetratricopeptide repeat protein [Sphingomonadaceae bacterium]|nr:tetratricopeptide repeat protein [Sphingomonadaceae bacterium]